MVGSELAFCTPPERDYAEAKFRGWKYRTIRDPKEVPLEVLREVARALISFN